MPNNLVAVRSPAQLDPAAHAECLGFIRAAIASNDRQTAHDIAAVLKDCYQRGYVDRVAIWADLTQTEQQQFQELLGPPPVARDFAKRIREAIGYNSPAVAGAIQTDLERAIDAGKLTAADVVAVVSKAEFAEFDRLLGSIART
jgi:hypothetical protein